MGLKPRSSICLEKKANTKRQPRLPVSIFPLNGVFPWMEMDSISLEKWTPRDQCLKPKYPGEGPIDRVIYNCQGAVTELNANDPSCPVKQWLPLEASCFNCRVQLQEAAFQHKHHGFLQHTHFILFNISQNMPLTNTHTKIEFFTFSTTLNNRQNKVIGTFKKKRKKKTIYLSKSRYCFL